MRQVHKLLLMSTHNICFLEKQVQIYSFLKRQAKLEADDILKVYFFLFFRKISLGILCESSAWQTIHMECQDLFSLKKSKCHLLQL